MGMARTGRINRTGIVVRHQTKQVMNMVNNEHQMFMENRGIIAYNIFIVQLKVTYTGEG